jgi:D-serine deaminase-like pyridoxal phosphate-dependent protein
LIESLAKNSGKKIPICIDLDVSTQYFGTHFGVNRSWIKSDERVAEFLKHLKTCPSLRLMSAMGYEAQIAGVPDVGFKFQLYKTLSSPELNSRRTRWVKQIEESVGKLEYVNGGGTGSFESTLQDPSVTELTSGSGLYSPGLFDHYKAFKHQPAAGYVLQIVRKPEENIITCFGGGYIASGGIGPLKVPVIMDPPGLTFFEREGAGEVQTPMTGESARSFKVGDLVFMRYAKAGEMNERFNDLYLVSKDKPTRTTPTYRGMGWNFG